MRGFSYSKMTMIKKGQKTFPRPSAEFLKGGVCMGDWGLGMGLIGGWNFVAN